MYIFVELPPKVDFLAPQKFLLWPLPSHYPSYPQKTTTDFYHGFVVLVVVITSMPK